MKLAWALAGLLLLAGCVAPENPDGNDNGAIPTPPHNGAPGNGQGLLPQEHETNATDPRVPGVILEGTMEACPAGFCLDAIARNQGPHTYQISSICVDPWGDRMEADGQHVHHREPMAVCLAFGVKPFAPGDEVPFQATWNGTLWDDGVYVEAPQGSYDWIAHFTLFEGDDGEGRHDLELVFPVIIGAT
jgi:hypothetical protein